MCLTFPKNSSTEVARSYDHKSSYLAFLVHPRFLHNAVHAFNTVAYQYAEVVKAGLEHIHVSRVRVGVTHVGLFGFTTPISLGHSSAGNILSQLGDLGALQHLKLTSNSP